MSSTPNRRTPQCDPHWRKTTLLLLLFAAVFSLSALLFQWIRWGGLAREEFGEFARLLLIFWSPYLGLALLTLWLGRHRLRAGVVLAGSFLVTLWGVYWHLDILLLRPSVISQIMSPILITGNQWLGVACTAVLALAAGLIRVSSLTKR